MLYWIIVYIFSHNDISYPMFVSLFKGIGYAELNEYIVAWAPQGSSDN